MHSEYLFYNHSPFELEQLKLLNNIYNTNSQHTLETLLRPGMNVLEVGCGSAILGHWIAERIGEEGTYVGIERDGQQIRMAEQDALENMVFIESEVERVSEIALLKGAEFDLIYGRWILAWVLPHHIEQLLATLYHMLTPNGKLVCEESDFSTTCCVHSDNYDKRIENVAFAQWYLLNFELAKRYSIDYTLGENIAHWLGKATGRVPYTSIFHPHLTKPANKQLLVLAMQSCRPAVISHNLATEEEMEALIDGLERLANDEAVHVHFAKDRIATVVRAGS